MKLSVSVPDELWTDVVGDSESPSAVVQQALRLLSTRKEEQRGLSHAPSAGVVQELRASGELDAIVDEIARDARAMAEAGYRVGIRLARLLGWTYLEELLSVTELLEIFCAMQDEQEDPSGAFGDEFINRIVEVD